MKTAIMLATAILLQGCAGLKIQWVASYSTAADTPTIALPVAKEAKKAQ